MLATRPDWPPLINVLRTCSASALTAAKLCGGCSGVVGASLGAGLRSKAAPPVFRDLYAYIRVGGCLERTVLGSIGGHAAAWLRLRAAAGLWGVHGLLLHKTPALPAWREHAMLVECELIWLRRAEGQPIHHTWHAGLRQERHAALPACMQSACTRRRAWITLQRGSGGRPHLSAPA